MNEHEISFQVNNNSRLRIGQFEFTIWKYKVKLSAEVASRGVLYKKLFLKISRYSWENTCVGVSFYESCRLQALGTPILKKSANGCLVHISVKNLTKVQLKCLFQNLRVGKVFAM